MFHRKLIGAALLVPLALLLSACWVSEEPLIGAAMASRIDIAGTYLDPDGEQIEIFDQGDGSYLMGSDGEFGQTLFMNLGDRWYLAQFEVRESGYIDEIGEEVVVYTYMPLQLVGDELTMFEPVCDQALASIPGIEVSDLGCGMDTQEALFAAARSLKQRIQSGQSEAERSTLIRQP